MKISAYATIPTQELFFLREEIEKIAKKIDFLITFAETEHACVTKRRASLKPEDCDARG